MDTVKLLQVFATFLFYFNAVFILFHFKSAEGFMQSKLDWHAGLQYIAFFQATVQTTCLSSRDQHRLAESTNSIPMNYGIAAD